MRYMNEYFNAHSMCDIEIHGNVVVATELDDNPGTSITNAAEYLATSVCKEFNINPFDLIWIEHYLPNKISKETYSMVTFCWIHGKFSHPVWGGLSEEERLKYLGHC